MKTQYNKDRKRLRAWRKGQFERGRIVHYKKRNGVILERGNCECLMMNLEPCDILADLLELTDKERTQWRGGSLVDQDEIQVQTQGQNQGQVLPQGQVFKRHFDKQAYAQFQG